MDINPVKITKAQSKIYEAIVSFMVANGFAPSVRDVCKMIGYKSPGSVYNHIVSLSKKGLISMNGSSNRMHITVPGLFIVDCRPEGLYQVIA